MRTQKNLQDAHTHTHSQRGKITVSEIQNHSNTITTKTTYQISTRGEAYEGKTNSKKKR